MLGIFALANVTSSMTAICVRIPRYLSAIQAEECKIRSEKMRSTNSQQSTEGSSIISTNSVVSSEYAEKLSSAYIRVGSLKFHIQLQVRFRCIIYAAWIFDIFSLFYLKQYGEVGCRYDVAESCKKFFQNPTEKHRKTAGHIETQIRETGDMDEFIERMQIYAGCRSVVRNMDVLIDWQDEHIDLESMMLNFARDFDDKDRLYINILRKEMNM